MSKKIIAYNVVVCNNETLHRLVNDVKLNLTNGWQPLGPCQIAVDDVASYHCQTMVKYEET